MVVGTGMHTQPGSHTQAKPYEPRGGLCVWTCRGMCTPVDTNPHVCTHIMGVQTQMPGHTQRDPQSSLKAVVHVQVCPVCVCAHSVLHERAGLHRASTLWGGEPPRPCPEPANSQAEPSFHRRGHSCVWLRWRLQGGQESPQPGSGDPESTQQGQGRGNTRIPSIPKG